MKIALKERTNNIAEIKASGGTTTKSTSKGASLKDKKRSIGKKASKPIDEDEDDDTDLFDDDDDF